MKKMTWLFCTIILVTASGLNGCNPKLQTPTPIATLQKATTAPATLEPTATPAIILSKVINHDSPVIMDFPPMPDTGCKDDGSGWVRCPEESPLGKLGCQVLQQPQALLSHLDPVYPLTLCIPNNDYEHWPEDQYLYNTGCSRPFYVHLVIFKDGEFTLIRNLADLQAVYAPIESREEALAFTLAATGLEAYYGLKEETGYRYHVTELEDTYVLEGDEGYQISLFHYQLCGCGPHTTFGVVVQVTKEGVIDLAKPVPLYEDPSQDGLCVD